MSEDISLRLTLPEDINPQLSDQDQQRLDSIQASIDFDDAISLAQFGLGAQRRLGDLSASLLRRIQQTGIGQAGEGIGQLMQLIQSLQVDSLGSRRGLLGGLFGGPQRELKKFSEQYDKLGFAIDRVEAELDMTRMGLLKDIGILDDLYEQNAKELESLSLHILAGESALEKAREGLPAAANEPLAAQRQRDREASLARFERRLYDLKLSRMVAMQTAPQIRLLQQNNKLLADKIQQAIYSALPLWRNQMTLAIGLQHQKSALRAQQDISRATADMVARSAATVRGQQRAIHQAMKGGQDEIARLKALNQELIDTLQQSLDAQAQGRQGRQQAEGELASAESRMRQALQSTASRG